MHRIASLLRQGQWQVLNSLQGTYCAAWHDPSSRSLSIWTDKLGVRPMFYSQSADLVIFSSALWLLEDLPFLSRTLDFQGAGEFALLGYPLADRTAYREIRRLLSGELIRFTNGSLPRRQRYFRLEDVPRSQESPNELARRAADAFRRAVQLLPAGRNSAVAFLSGGLDSRLIVGALREGGIQTATYNFSLPNSLDDILAARYAEACGAQHRETEWVVGSHVVTSLDKAWRNGIQPPFRVEQPRLAWSVDGGSVGLGAVYITQEIEEQIARSRYDAVAGTLARNAGALPLSRLFRSSLRASAAGIPCRGIDEGIRTPEGAVTLYSLYSFLMLNDQRHHLHGFYESCHKHRYDLHLPFFDGRFLECVASVPAETRLYHRFYTLVLDEFPAHVTSVPWQTYPEHDPCPLPLPHGALQQWTDAFRRQVRSLQEKQLKEEIKMLSFRRRSGLFNEPALGLALLTAHLGLRRFRHTIRLAAAFQRCWRNCTGEVDTGY